jgi:hypothetical protein
MEFDNLEPCMMVDTLGLRIHNIDPTRLPKKFGQFGEGDEKKWATGDLKSAAGKTTMLVKAVKSRKTFCIEGSPASLFQGHNIVSSGDAQMLAYATVKECNRALDLGLNTARAVGFVRGTDMEITRIDTPVLLRKPKGLPTSAVMNALAFAGIRAGHNTSLYVGESVYFDQNSQLASLKGYDKLVDIQRKRLLKIPDTPHTPALMGLVADTVRMEAVYRQKWLQRKFPGELITPALLNPSTLAWMFRGLLDNYNLRWNLRMPLNTEALMYLPSACRQYVLLWQSGHDLTRIKAENPTAYSRVLNYLKKEHSINLEGLPPKSIEEKIELGELLHPSNFIPVPEEIQADRELFFSLDMERERKHLGPMWGRPMTRTPPDTGDHVAQ